MIKYGSNYNMLCLVYDRRGRSSDAGCKVDHLTKSLLPLPALALPTLPVSAWYSL